MCVVLPFILCVKYVIDVYIDDITAYIPTFVDLLGEIFFTHRAEFEVFKLENPKTRPSVLTVVERFPRNRAHKDTNPRQPPS